MSVEIDEVHAVQKEMLKAFIRFCEKHGLTYYICGGTLLGAIRHKGFIPWDDDVDILMTRPEFERFGELAKKEKVFPTGILTYYKEGNSFFPFYKLGDTRYEVLEENTEDKEKQYLWIDIFPMDGLSADEEENRKLYRKMKFYRELLTIRMLRKERVVEGSKTKLKALVKPVAKFFIDRKPATYYAKKIDRLSQTYDYRKSKYVGGAMWGYGPQERMLKSEVEQVVSVEFEGLKVKTFSCWEKYLTNLYGDYMKLPPKEQRETHLAKIKKVG